MPILAGDLRMIHVHEIRPRKDKRGVDLISDVLPFGGLWCGLGSGLNEFIACIPASEAKWEATVRPTIHVKLLTNESAVDDVPPVNSTTQ